MSQVLDTSIDHLITEDENVVPSPIPGSLGSDLLDDGDRVKSYIRAEAIKDNGSPKRLLGIAVIVDVCISSSMFLVSSYERQVFGSGADDVITSRAYCIFPLDNNVLGEFQNELIELHDFREIEVEGNMSVEDLQEEPIQNLIPRSDDDNDDDS